jgi:dihydrofolate reductase
MSIAIIAAVADNGCIGKDNKIPWHIPEDFRYFKKMTTGKTCLMGMATFKSILGYLGKPLPDRKTAVLSRNTDNNLPPNVVGFSSIEEAFEKLKNEEVFICGGANIYNQTINLVDTLYITEIHQQPEGDTFFPKIDNAIWKEVGRENHETHSFVTYKKK